MDRIKLLVIGPPACGKTTVAKALSGMYKLDYSSSGDFARSIMTQENKEALAVGELSPDHLAIAEWVTEKLRADRDVIIDGFPRSQEQFSVFDFRIVTAVLWLDVPVGECMKRAGLRNRSDDGPKTFWRRYINYMKYTAPLMFDLSHTAHTSFIHLVTKCDDTQEQTIKEAALQVTNLVKRINSNERTFGQSKN